MTRFIRRGLGCAAVAALLAGCGKAPPPPIVPVEGVVRLDGKPLPNAQVRFIPQIDHGPEFVATGVTDKDGKFQLTCNGKPGACACEHMVLIAEAELPDRLLSEKAQGELAKYKAGLVNRPIPPKFGTLAETPLRVTPSGDKPTYDLELTR